MEVNQVAIPQFMSYAKKYVLYHLYKNILFPWFKPW